MVEVDAPWPEPDRALFSISVAAELAGLHPQTLRVYEREGLLEPARTPGGTRRYSGREVDRLREMATLADEGVNIAGIRRVMDLESRVRRLEVELASLHALDEEMRKLKAESRRRSERRKRSRSDGRAP